MEALAEEFEVLESIYPAELSKLSERVLQIDVEPEELEDGEETLKLTLEVQYPDGYPDVLPLLSLDSLEGELDETERQHLLSELRIVGEDNLGMAMTFTIVSHLREQLSLTVHARSDKKRKEEMEKERLAIEVEEARTRGTQVTLESFNTWKTQFDAEQAMVKAKDDDEKLRGLTPKEREEWKRMGSRLTGRQLFERNKNLEEESLMEDGTVSVDVTQFERQMGDEDEDEDHITFSDSD